MLKILELFGGIGAPRKALENLNIKIKSIDYVEILPYAVKAYNRIFNNDYDMQDITKWNINVDLLIHGSPCQDWSKNGLNNINTGRSILYERTLEIIEKELHPRPKFILWENVPNLLSDRHVQHFNHYLEKMESLGYTNSFDILNAKHYGMPQNRERVYVVSILDGEEFKFPEPIKLEKRLKDYIDFDIDPSEYALSENELNLFFERDGKMFIHTNTRLGYQEVEEFDSINVERPTSKTRRGRVGKQVVQTLTTSPNQAVFYNGNIRKITARECWRLTGFTDEDYDNVAQQGIGKVALYKLPGNSIVVPVLESIFKGLLLDTE
ncbi:DNA (cytosine-5-)-methyltransferase [Carnobacterium maltaromaticum]|uniref:DNA (cytosine-5-)-methyltransferase n=1 Tax=Carnobacterium maltaromaticum TaxID=2751 RepID=UPI00026C88C2|nr:DNA (cytosine-5-)-methyltransferase [Carnobacterium maltaromaticum]